MIEVEILQGKDTIIDRINSNQSQADLEFSQIATLINNLILEVASIKENVMELKLLSQEVNNYYREIYEFHVRTIEEQKRRIAELRKHQRSSRIRALFQSRLNIHPQHPGKKLSIPQHYFKAFPLRDTPVISLVTPTLNQAQFIEHTINSALEQNYAKFEYIIQDGSSNDDTVEVIQRYESLLKHWESKPDKGQTNAINLGFKHATGEIMGYLNSDDILLPGALNYVAHYFQTHPNIDVIYSHRVLIDERNLEIGRWILPGHHNKVLKWADYIPQETLFWRRSIWEKVGAKLDENFQFAMDWDLLLRFQEAGARFARVPRFLGAFRVHSQQKSSSIIDEKGFEEMKKLRERNHKREITKREVRRNIRFYLLSHAYYQKLYRLGLLKY